MKPNDYRVACTIMKETPYRVADGDLQEAQASEGMLQQGRVVWLKKNLGESSAEAQVSAYVEGIGLISVAPKILALVH